VVPEVGLVVHLDRGTSRPRRELRVCSPARSSELNTTPRRPRTAWLWSVCSARVDLPQSIVPGEETRARPCGAAPGISGCGERVACERAAENTQASARTNRGHRRRPRTQPAGPGRRWTPCRYSRGRPRTPGRRRRRARGRCALTAPHPMVRTTSLTGAPRRCLAASRGDPGDDDGVDPLGAGPPRWRPWRRGSSRSRPAGSRPVWPHDEAGPG